MHFQRRDESIGRGCWRRHRAELAMGMTVVASCPYYGGRAVPGKSGHQTRTDGPDGGVDGRRSGTSGTAMVRKAGRLKG
jgi:hypothetical protein